MVVNGLEGPRYDDVAIAIFSPDSSRIAYLALKNKKNIMLIDAGKPGLRAGWFFELQP